MEILSVLTKMSFLKFHYHVKNKSCESLLRKELFSLCYNAETNTPLWSNYTPIKMFKKKKLFKMLNESWYFGISRNFKYHPWSKDKKQVYFNASPGTLGTIHGQSLTINPSPRPSIIITLISWAFSVTGHIFPRFHNFLVVVK